MPTVERERPAAPPTRFATARSTLFVDALMTWLIRAGGVGVIIAVCLIFVFIASRILPLFGGASVAHARDLALPPGAPVVAMGLDEWGEVPFVLRADGNLVFLPADGSAPTATALPEGGAVAAAFYQAGPHRLVAVLADGALGTWSVAYRAEFVEGRRTIVPALEAGMRVGFLPADARALALGYGDGGSERLAAAIYVRPDGGRGVAAQRVVSRKKGLRGAVTTEVDGRWELGERIAGTPELLLVDERAERLLVANEAGEVFSFVLGADGPELVQRFRPIPGERLARLDWLFGDVTVSAVAVGGAHVAWSLQPLAELDGRRGFGPNKTFAPLPAAATAHAASTRNKAFLVAAGDAISLRYLTTGQERWSTRAPAPIEHVAFDGKYERFALVAGSTLSLWRLHDPHPQTSLGTLFGKVQYEGYAEPRWMWQSSSGNDDFEPKLSMMPLIFGTLKGTFYAMLFSVPIALLAAIYTAEFMHPRFRSIVKPTMEIMASLPSVVLGYLAAQWLAPRIEMRVPGLICAFVLVPLAVMAFGHLWARLPSRVRSRIRPGYEYLVLVPLVALVGWGALALGPVLEALVFTVRDAHTDQVVADFRRWWPDALGASYEQRNSLVVGFMMGFAVIPIIFTITDDALTNVPKALRSGSLALGASRWQTAFRVVVPTASAGIFSALMIGLGRAIGETMIVVMATGNTAILDWNIFSGMRTLSANIAVELPEASRDGTLYRTLFLGAMLLFLMTFVINTIAEVLRQRLREKYKTV